MHWLGGDVFTDFHACFKSVSDKRPLRKSCHVVVLFACLIAFLIGFHSAAGAHRFFQSRWRSMLVLFGDRVRHSDPLSHSTVTRIVRGISDEEYSLAHVLFMQLRRKKLNRPTTGITISIDAKVMRTAADGSEGPLVYMSSAMCQEDLDCLTFVKSGPLAEERHAAIYMVESGMIPVWRNLLTFDALYNDFFLCMMIGQRGGRYLITLKENQPRLHQLVMDYLWVNFDNCTSKYKEKDKKHKGVTRESRIYHLTDEEQRMFKWLYMKAIGIYKVNVPGRDSQYRYFILSKKMGVKRFAKAVRGHWGIEIMHYILDVSMDEDKHQARKDDSPIIFAGLRRLALHFLRLSQHSTTLKGEMDLGKICFWHQLGLLCQFKKRFPKWANSLHDL